MYYVYDISQQMGLFYLEAEMAISDELQEFCVLECSGCKQKKRTKDRKDFHCPKCNRKTTLLPRYFSFSFVFVQLIYLLRNTYYVLLITRIYGNVH